jgi:putative endonuclease
METHFVYIIHSVSHDIYYRGYSTQPKKRLQQHNENESRYTKAKGPWALVFIQFLFTKRQALIRERRLKKYSKAQIKQLLDSPKNEI